MMLGLVSTCLVTAIIGIVTSSPDLDLKHQLCFARLSDLNLMLNFGFSDYDGSLKPLACDPDEPLYGSHMFVYIEAFRYAIDMVNKNDKLLPNVSLGYIIMDNCWQSIGALATVLFSLPDRDDPAIFPDDELVTCKNGYKRFTNVFGVFGPSSSSQAVMVGGLSTLFEIPMIFDTATSDELSDKSRYTYTMRLIPPDRFAAEAMMDIMIGFGWNYASVLYYEGPYGENGAKQIDRKAKETGVCIGFSFMFPSDYNEQTAVEAAKLLLRFKQAKVILSFIGSGAISILLPLLEEMGLADHFLWIGSDIFPIGGYGGITDGSLRIDFKLGHDPQFDDYFAKLNPVNTPDNPYMPYFWKLAHECDWKSTHTNNSCNDIQEIPHGQEISERSQYGRVLDGVQVFARGLHNFMMEKCPEAFGNRRLVRECLVGRELHQHMLNVSFVGVTDDINFDEKGDLRGKFLFKQYHEYNKEYVVAATWNKNTQKLDIMYENLLWHSGVYNDSRRGMIPEAVCSKPCKNKEYYIQKEVDCCWDCRICRNNEIIVDNKTNCLLCPLYTWPDEETSTVCQNIKPDVLKWTSPMTITIVAVTGTGLLLCILTTILFIRHKDTKLIKASSRELMAIILTGIVLAYMTVFFMLTYPSEIICYIQRFGFNLSVSFIFAPLMIKTNRVYRIFTAGKKGSRKPLFTGIHAQIFIVVFFLLIQGLLCLVSAILAAPNPVLQMRVHTVKYVEILCSLPLSGLLPPLCLNLFLILICAVYGFLTRKLPENFNESWYIFVSVATTTFLWLVFLPAYFTAFYAIHQVLLLCCCLIINATMTLLCLYFPKIYCIYFVNESDIQFQTAGTIGTMKIGPTVANLSTLQSSATTARSFET